jgi:hypothetical protein
MRTTTVENAKITGTTLGREGHGIMSAYIHLEGAGWGVSFGGYALDQWDKAKDKRVGTAYGLAFVMAVLDTVGVDSWEKLTGQYVRVVSEGWGGSALKIGHITKDVWFDPAALAAEMGATK